MEFLERLLDKKIEIEELLNGRDFNDLSDNEKHRVWLIAIEGDLSSMNRYWELMDRFNHYKKLIIKSCEDKELRDNLEALINPWKSKTCNPLIYNKPQSLTSDDSIYLHKGGSTAGKL